MPESKIDSCGQPIPEQEPPRAPSHREGTGAQPGEGNKSETDLPLASGSRGGKRVIEAAEEGAGASDAETSVVSPMGG